jgi:hypothetical protein
LLRAAAATLLFATAGGVQAQDDERQRIPFASPGDDSAMIVGTIGRPAQFIYPVEFIAVNGRNIAPRDAIWPEPGEHELTVRGFVTNPPGLRSAGRFRSEDGSNRIDVVVEAGNEYWVGMKYDRKRSTDPYRTVLYRVERD